MADEAAPVHLYVYDLSKGTAKVISAVLAVIKPIDAIWHTGVVAYGTEYFFGPRKSGIQRNPVGSGEYGSTIDVVHLGFTTVSKGRLEAFLQEIQPRYTPSAYDVALHNCNSFSDELSRFLVGSGIPEAIRRLPLELTTSVLGVLSPLIWATTRFQRTPSMAGVSSASQQRQHEWRHRGAGVCRAVLARGLSVCWGHEPAYWRWRKTTEGAVPGAWSVEAAELLDVCWLDVRAQVRGPWTPRRRYTVSLRLAWRDVVRGFSRAPVTMEVCTSDGQREVREVMLDSPATVAGQRPNGCGCVRRRAAGAPGWFEYDVGEFVVTAGQEEVTVSVAMHEHGGHWKKGLVLDAVLVRPNGSLPLPSPDAVDGAPEAYQSPVTRDNH